MAAWAAITATSGLVACGAGPMVPRPDAGVRQPAAAASSVQSVARQVSITGHAGRLTRDERERLLRRLAAQGQATLVQRHLAAMGTYGDVGLYANNRARLLIDGPATFAAMFAAIERARETVLLESYIVEDEALAQRLADLLLKKRAQGVEVALIYDGVGSIATDSAYFERLREGGVAVCEFNPVNPFKRGGYWDITERDHRKILVVDREVAFTGGINVSGVYSSGSFGRQKRAVRKAVAEEGWRDTQIELRGPAARALDDLVRQTWAHQQCRGETGTLPPRADAAPAGPAGGEVVSILPSSPGDEYNRIYAMLLTAIDASVKSVHLTMAYFAPGQDMIDALADAARRGVDVKLILPSLSDFAPVLHAGRSYYSELLRAGVQIHELQDAVLHAKTAVVDGVLSTVGSSNMDWRSFTGNHEVNAVVVGDDFGQAMERMFERDLQASARITSQAWRQRPVWQRAKELAARLFERWW